LDLPEKVPKRFSEMMVKKSDLPCCNPNKNQQKQHIQVNHGSINSHHSFPSKIYSTGRFYHLEFKLKVPNLSPTFTYFFHRIFRRRTWLLCTKL